MTRVVLDVPHTRAGHCGSGSMRDLLTFAGLSYGDAPISEALTFALAGGLAFQYARTAGITPPIYLVGRTGEMELDLVRRLGGTVETVRSDDPDEGWRNVADQLDAGRPALIHADILELPYLRVTLSNTRHSLIVSGYDTEAGEAYLVDNDRDEVQTVALDDLDRARSSTGFPDAPRYATFPLTWPDELPDLRTVARDACGAVARQMSEGATLFAEEMLPTGALSAAGLDGLSTFVEDLARWPDLFRDATDQVGFALWVFIEKAGTGGSMFRRLQADGLREAGERTGDVALLRAADTWAAAADGWSDLARAIRDDTGRLVDLAARLPSLERDAVVATERAAG